MYDWEIDQKVYSTHLGIADDHIVGTARILQSETCLHSSGATIPLTVTEGEGTTTTSWGDEIHFRVRQQMCALGPESVEQIGYWVVDGGTGRFEDASEGSASSTNPVYAALTCTRVPLPALEKLLSPWKGRNPAAGVTSESRNLHD